MNKGEMIGCVLACLLILGMLAFGDFDGDVVEISNNAPYPIQLVCMADEDRPAEGEFCKEYTECLLATGLVDLAYNSERPYFKFAVMPTSRDEYIAVQTAVTFQYPLFEGLSFGVNYGNYFISTEEVAVPDVVQHIAGRMLSESHSWLIWAKDKILKLKMDDSKYMEA